MHCLILLYLAIEIAITYFIQRIGRFALLFYFFQPIIKSFFYSQQERGQVTNQAANITYIHFSSVSALQEKSNQNNVCFLDQDPLA